MSEERKSNNQETTSRQLEHTHSNFTRRSPIVPYFPKEAHSKSFYDEMEAAHDSEKHQGLLDEIGATGLCSGPGHFPNQFQHPYAKYRKKESEFEENQHQEKQGPPVPLNQNKKSKRTRNDQKGNLEWPGAPLPLKIIPPLSPFQFKPAPGEIRIPEIPGGLDYPLEVLPKEESKPNEPVKAKKSKKKKGKEKGKFRFRDFHYHKEEVEKMPREPKEALFKEFLVKKLKKEVPEASLPFFTEEILKMVDGSVQKFLEIMDNRESKNYKELLEKLQKKQETQN